jgi:cell division septum initiation protein DivIVA
MSLSPEEIRHVSISHSIRGYDRRETDQLLARIADSFESVWHQRTDLYAEVKRLEAELQDAGRLDKLRKEEIAGLRERLRDLEPSIATLRDEIKRLEAAREALIAERERAQAEQSNVRSRLLEQAQQEVAHEKELMAMKHRKLSEFLLATLKDVEQASTNGSANIHDLAELEALRDELSSTE